MLGASPNSRLLDDRGGGGNPRSSSTSLINHLIPRQGLFFRLSSSRCTESIRVEECCSNRACLLLDNVDRRRAGGERGKTATSEERRILSDQSMQVRCWGGRNLITHLSSSFGREDSLVMGLFDGRTCRVACIDDD